MVIEKQKRTKGKKRFIPLSDFNAEVKTNQISHKDTYYILYGEILTQENIEPYVIESHLSRLHYNLRDFYEILSFF